MNNATCLFFKALKAFRCCAEIVFEKKTCYENIHLSNLEEFSLNLRSHNDFRALLSFKKNPTKPVRKSYPRRANEQDNQSQCIVKSSISCENKFFMFPFLMSDVHCIPP